MKPPKIKLSRIEYFPIVKHWRKLRPLYKSPEIEQVWRLNLRDFSEQGARENNHSKYRYKDDYYKVPCDHGGHDWIYNWARRGRHPEYYDYVCYRACHFVADMNLHVAMKAYPEVPWRIVTHQQHSTIWNGDPEQPILFDPNFLALNVTAKDAWKAASRGRMLRPGQPLRPYVFRKDYFARL